MILLLAGTGEGRALAQALADRSIPALASLAGATDDPRPYPIPTRVGGFGGAEGFMRQLDLRGITAVVDATHPFAARITDRTAQICADRGLPYLRLQRPGWTATEGDRWNWVQNADEAAAQIPDDACVFLATGRQSLPEFAGLRAERVLVRVVDPPCAPPPFDKVEWIVARGPFDLAAERRLFETEKVSWIITKDAGGDGARAKLDAARDLGLPVILIRRSPDPEAPVVSTIEEALAWVAAL